MRKREREKVASEELPLGQCDVVMCVHPKGLIT